MNVVARFGFYTNMLPHAMNLMHILLSIVHYTILDIRYINYLNMFSMLVYQQIHKYY